MSTDTTSRPGQAPRRGEGKQVAYTPATPEELKRRAEGLDELIRRSEAEPPAPGEVEEALAMLRDIDEDRASRGLAKLWEGYY